MKIVIVGLGNIGQELARLLIEKKNNVVLIDQSQEITESLAEQMDAVTLTGDGSNPEILKEAKLDKADALIAVTGSDAINLVIAMIAKQWHVENIVIKLSKSSLKPAGAEIVQDIVIVMPHTSAANAIVQSIYGKEKSNIAQAIGGALYQDILEFDKTTRVKIKDLDLPDDCLVIAVQREDDVLLAKSDLKLQKGDQLILLSENEQTFIKVEKSFGGNA